MSYPAYESFVRQSVAVGYHAWFAYMHLLNDDGGLSLGEYRSLSLCGLADHLGVRVRTAHRAVARLESFGLVTQASDRETRRTQYRIAMLAPADFAAGAVLDACVPRYPWQQAERRKEVVRFATARRKARKLNSVGQFTPEDVRSKYHQQNGLCYYCATVLGTLYQVEHMVPLARGGSNGPENICLSCAPCNRRKGTQTAEEFMARVH